jgi:hypothetical protein
MLTDASLPIWVIEHFPEVVDRKKGLFNSYFEDLRKCGRDLEVARSDLSAALGRRPPRRGVDVDGIWKQQRPRFPELPLFNSCIPRPYLFLLKEMPFLHGLGQHLCSKALSVDLDHYCNQLTRMLRRTIQEWIDEVREVTAEEFLTAVGNIAVVAEAT